MKCLHLNIFIKTSSLEELPTKAKDDPLPHDTRLSLLLLFIYSLLTKKMFHVIQKTKGSLQLTKKAIYLYKSINTIFFISFKILSKFQETLCDKVIHVLHNPQRLFSGT